VRIGLGYEYLWLILLGLATGVIAAACMILHGFWQIVTTVLLCIFLVVLVFMVKKCRKRTRAVLVYLVAVMLGYLLSCVFICVFLGRAETGDIDPAERREETAILLLSPGEITEYSSRSALYRLAVERETGLGGVYWWNTPVKALQLKKNIERLDRDDCILTGQNLYNKLSEELGDGFALYRANLFGPPFIETTMGEILNNGYGKVVVLNNFLVEQPYKETVDKKLLSIIEKSNTDAEVLFTFPLWNHDELISYYEQCILEKTQEISPEQVGVVLVAKGSGRRIRNKYPQAQNHEQVFYDKIKESIMKNGFESRKVKVAYLGYRKPDIGDAVDYLLDSGISKLVIVAAGFENRGIYTERVLPKAIERIDLPDHVDTVIIGPWGDSDLLVRALMDRLDMVDVLK
jgi:protoheme ferro-lyase